MASLSPPVLSLTNTIRFGRPLTPATFELSFSTLDTEPGASGPSFFAGFFENGAMPAKITPVAVPSSPAILAAVTSAGGRPVDIEKHWYQVVVASTSPSGSPSGSDWPLLSSGLPALFFPATLRAVAWDGRLLRAAWSPPGAGVRTGGVRLYVTAGDVVRAFDLPGTSGAIPTDGIPLAAGATVHVAPLVSPGVPPASWTSPLSTPPAAVPIHPAQSPYPAVSLGPVSNPVVVQTAAYAVTAVDAAAGGGTWTAAIQAGPPSTAGTFDVLLTANGALVHTFSGVEQGGGEAIVLDLGPYAPAPVPGVLLELAVRFVALETTQAGASPMTTVSTGPAGRPAPLVATPPVLSTVELATATRLAFAGETRLPLAAGVQVTLGATTALAPASGTIDVDPVAPGEPHTVRFRAAVALPDGGASLGPAAVVTLLPPPVVDAVARTGETVRARWSAVEGAAAYRMELVSAEGVAAWEAFDGTAGAIALPPGPGGPFAVRVRTVARPAPGTTTVGLPSTPVEVRGETFAVASIDATAGGGAWTAAVRMGPPSTTGVFNVLHTANGVLVQTFAGVEQGGGGPVVLELGPVDPAPVPGVLHQLAVQSVASIPGGAVSTGPTGPASPLVAAPPGIEAVELETAGRLAFTTAARLPFAAGVQVTLGGTTALAPASGAVEVGGIDPGEPQAVAFRAAVALPDGGLSLGPAATVTLLPPPVVDGVTLTGGTVQARWNAVDGATAYRLELLGAAGVVAHARFGGTAGALALPPGMAGPFAVRARTVAGPATGLPSPAAVAVLADAPRVTDVVTDPVTGATTLAWPPVEGAAYRVRLVTGGVAREVDAAGPALDAGVLAPNADVSVTLAAVVRRDGAVVQGPFGPPVALPTAQPTGVRVDFNGLAAAVAWLPVPAATGYAVSLYAPGAAAPAVTAQAPAGATRAVLDAASLDPGAAWRVVVQARVNGWTGPPSAPVPLFTPGYFVGSAAAATQPTLVPGTTLALGAEAVRLSLPPLLADGAEVAPAGPFALGRDGDGAYPWTLTIGPEAFEFPGAAIRPAVRAAYHALLQGAQNAGAAPWGIALLQQVISRAMPQTFDETLFYAYGLDLAAGCADLRPGMVLRVVVNDYLDLGANVASPWLNGFIGGGVLDYDVGSYLAAGSWLVGFDAFLAQLAAAGALVPGAPPADPLARQAAGIAEAADLFHPAFRTPFYRLFFPPTLQSASGTGSVVTAQNFTIAAASSYTALANATSAPSAAHAVAYFRGRAVVKLCIRVFVNGVESVVPVGTTVGNLLERYAAQVPGVAAPFGGISLLRARGLVVTEPDQPYDVGGAWPVNLGWKQLMTYGSPAATALSLPLLHGDRLRIGA